MSQYAIGDEVLGGWRIARLIGEGAFGRVFEVEKAGFGLAARSALKVVSIPPSDSMARSMLAEGMDQASVAGYFRGVVDDFAQEIALLSGLSHPGIVSYQDHAIVPHGDGAGWDVLLRMELLEPLTARMEEGVLPEAEVARLGAEVADALAYCHSRRVVHRDVKPGNLFADPDGRYKIGDFGVSRTMEHTTGALSHKGTEAYMAPELFRGEPYGADVDVYALGLVLYQLLNGNRLPFLPPAPAPVGYRDRETAKAKRLSGEPLPALACAPELLAAVLAACSPDPVMRPSAAQLRDMVGRLRGAKLRPATVSSPKRAASQKASDAGNVSSEQRSTIGVWDAFGSGPNGSSSPSSSQSAGKGHVSNDSNVQHREHEVERHVFPRSSIHVDGQNGDTTVTMLVTRAQVEAGTTVRVPGVAGTPLEVTLPKSIKDGQRLRLKGQGNPTPSGVPGNLYIRVKVVDKARSVPGS